MKPLEPAEFLTASLDRLVTDLVAQGVSADAARKIALDSVAGYEVFLNDQYQVIRRMFRAPFAKNGYVDMWHLSIKRRDKETIHDWRDLQAIKTQLCGPECEGVELYPAESRLVDTANQYHLWVIADPNIRFPFGFDDGRVTEAPFNLSASKQRPRED